MTDKNSVYVVIANENKQVKECIVFSEFIVAEDWFKRLKEIWGGDSVALVSRRIDNILIFIDRTGDTNYHYPAPLCVLPGGA